MTRKTEIFRNQSAFGGYSYRVLANESAVAIQQSNQGATWRTVKLVPRAQFDTWADDVGLHDPYNQNPSKLARFAKQ
jgi:hypothetical protein